MGPQVAAGDAMGQSWMTRQGILQHRQESGQVVIVLDASMSYSRTRNRNWMLFLAIKIPGPRGTRTAALLTSRRHHGDVYVIGSSSGPTVRWHVQYRHRQSNGPSLTSLPSRIHCRKASYRNLCCRDFFHWPRAGNSPSNNSTVNANTPQYPLQSLRVFR